MAPKHGGTSITIDSIAAACGKSRTAVSAVLRGEAEKYRIHPETAELIRLTAERLGWKPNFFARSLNKKKTHTIGVVFPDVFERFMGETVRGIESILQRADYRMLLSTSRFDWREELKTIANFQYRGVDGLIIVPCAEFVTAKHPEHASELIRHIDSLPCIVLDRTISGLKPQEQGYGFVVQADYQGAYEAVQYLAKNRKAPTIGYLGFNLEASSLAQRLAGFQDACSAFSLRSQELLLDCQDSQSTDLVHAIHGMMQKKALPRHWLVATEGLSYRLAALLQDRGYRFGKDLQIARFGSDIPYYKTGFINIAQPHKEMGATAAELLLGLINIEENTELYREIPVTIETG